MMLFREQIYFFVIVLFLLQIVECFYNPRFAQASRYPAIPSTQLYNKRVVAVKRQHLPAWAVIYKQIEEKRKHLYQTAGSIRNGIQSPVPYAQTNLYQNNIKKAFAAQSQVQPSLLLNRNPSMNFFYNKKKNDHFHLHEEQPRYNGMIYNNEYAQRRKDISVYPGPKPTFPTLNKLFSNSIYQQTLRSKMYQKSTPSYQRKLAQASIKTRQYVPTTQVGSVRNNIPQNPYQMYMYSQPWVGYSSFVQQPYPFVYQQFPGVKAAASLKKQSITEINTKKKKIAITQPNQNLKTPKITSFKNAIQKDTLHVFKTNKIHASRNAAAKNTTTNLDWDKKDKIAKIKIKRKNIPTASTSSSHQNETINSTSALQNAKENSTLKGDAFHSDIKYVRRHSFHPSDKTTKLLHPSEWSTVQRHQYHPIKGSSENASKRGYLPQSSEDQDDNYSESESENENGNTNEGENPDEHSKGENEDQESPDENLDCK